MAAQGVSCNPVVKEFPVKGKITNGNSGAFEPVRAYLPFVRKNFRSATHNPEQIAGKYQGTLSCGVGANSAAGVKSKQVDRPNQWSTCKEHTARQKATCFHPHLPFVLVLFLLSIWSHYAKAIVYPARR